MSTMGPFIGVIFAIGSALCTGSYGTLLKLKSIQDAQVAPHVFNFWMNIGVCLSSLTLVPNLRPGFTRFGLISGLCFVISNACAFVAIQLLGLSTATSLCFGSTVLSAVLVGALLLVQHIFSPMLASIGLLLLVPSIAGVAYSNVHWPSGSHTDHSQIEFAQFTAVDTEDHDESENALMMGRSSSSSNRSTAGAIRVATRLDPDKARFAGLTKDVVSGIVSAVLSGGFAALVPIPMRWADRSTRGLQFIPSMAVGVALFSPLVTLIMHHRATGRLPCSPELKAMTKAAVLPGLISGAMWNLGNVLSILALLAKTSVFTRPILQCSLFIASLWGVLYFKEMNKRGQVILWPAAIATFVGAVLVVRSMGGVI